ncbi:MAG: response regulator, partial [Desulfovibrio sp.]|nr:response regulator [Desulfovibrio sp.]
MDVLIVDDERTFAELLAERLRLRGYAVRVAGTAEAALEQMEDAPSDVALLDVGLPGMDGLSLLERIRGLWPGTACCMLTGASQVDAAARALRHGAFDWLAKPVSLACVEDVLARAQARQQEAREQELLAEAAR